MSYFTENRPQLKLSTATNYQPPLKDARATVDTAVEIILAVDIILVVDPYINKDKLPINCH